MTDEEYTQMAVMAIKRYLNYSCENITMEILYSIEDLYGLAIKRLVMKAKEIDAVKVNGVTQFTTDGQTYTFNGMEAFTITPDVAILLPNPKKFHAW